MKSMRSILVTAIALMIACTSFAEERLMVAFNADTQQMTSVFWTDPPVPVDVQMAYFSWDPSLGGSGDWVQMENAAILTYVPNLEADDSTEMYIPGYEAADVSRHWALAVLTPPVGMPQGAEYRFKAEATVMQGSSRSTLVAEDVLTVVGNALATGTQLAYSTSGCPGESLPAEIMIGGNYCATICHGSVFIPIYCEDPGYTPDLMQISIANGCDAATECSQACEPLDHPELLQSQVLVYPGCWLFLQLSYCGDDQGCICISRGDFFLPVEMGAFDAITGDRSVTLNWNTSSETNVDKFIVKRDGEAVAEVTASNLPTGGSYQWTDANVVNGRVYSYTLIVRDRDGSEATAAEAIEASPRATANTVGEYKLSQNYPNPFNSETSFSYTIPEAQHVTLTIYDLLGREIAVLVNGPMAAGTHTQNWSADGLAAGVYMYTLTAGDFNQTNKMLYLK
jgi:hypothetical protein